MQPIIIDGDLLCLEVMSPGYAISTGPANYRTVSLPHI